MKHADLLALLLPPVSYERTGPRLTAGLVAEGAALDLTRQSAQRAAGGITPFYAGALLADWERVCAVTPGSADSYQQRLQAVLAKLAEVGGLSRPYFIRLAERLGYHIEIVEPEPFRAGRNRAGERLWIPEIIWVWQVIIHGRAGAQVWRFRAGQSVAGERLTAFGDPVIEAVFEDLKPAHTFVYFAYLES